MRKASVFQNHTHTHTHLNRGREMGTERLLYDQVDLQDRNELVSVSFVNNADGIMRCFGDEETFTFRGKEDISQN